MSLKVMLVDDEPFILQGLTMLISWEEENCRIVKTAANGMEAYEYLKENQVDLVLTDVEMPVMDGLTLLEKVRREKISDACFAILSGYNDFSYAQKAIAFSCVEYLLKPVSGEALLKLIKRVDEKKEKADYENAVKKDLKRSYLIQSIAALLQGKAEPETISYIRENLSFSGRRRDVQISPDGVSFLEELSDKERKELRNRIYENVCAFLAEDAACCIRDFPGLSEEYEVTLLYDEAFSKKRGMTTERFLEKLLAAAGKGLETEIVLTVGKAVEDPEKLSHSYSSACVLKSSQGFRAKKSIYYYEKEVQMNQSRMVLCKQSIDRLLYAVEQNIPVEIHKSIDELFSEMQEMGLTADVVSMNTNYLLFQLIHLAVEQDESVDQEEVMLYISENVSESGIARGSKIHLKRFACEYAEYLVQLRQKVSRGVLLSVEREVREHYAENLTLKDLSKTYFVNSSYLGQIFRKKYGQSFKDYLNSYRIKESAVLLLRTDKKVSEIAEDVGYHDTDYFIRKFIEMNGCTPARYRKNARQIPDESKEVLQAVL